MEVAEGQVISLMKHMEKTLSSFFTEALPSLHSPKYMCVQS